MIALAPERRELAGGDDPAYREVVRQLEVVARSTLSVVLTGPTGVGKSTLARLVHDLSGRRGRFVTVDCPTLRPEIFASELFGHVRGAFTGAERTVAGKVEAARGGTLFFEEVGDLSRENQAKLLSFLGSGRYSPVGSDEERTADVRVVSATNLELSETLRADFVRRIADEVIRVPGLDARPLGAQALGERCHPRPLSAEALVLLVARTWPDNVGGLSRAVHRALVRANHEGAHRLLPRHFELAPIAPTRTLDAKLAALERLVLVEALQAHAHCVTATARALVIPRQRLHRRLLQLGVARPR